MGGFATRLSSVIDKRQVASVARAIDVPAQTLHNWLRGKGGPGGDKLFALAETLAVSARWLAIGAEPMRPSAAHGDGSDRIQLPFYDLFGFTQSGKPEALEEVPIPREWLVRVARRTTGLWLAEMPSDALPDVAREGDTIICSDPETPLVDGRVYVLLLDGRPLVRRVQIRPEGMVLKAGNDIDPIVLEPDQLEDRFVPIGRVLATINLSPV